MLWIVYTIESKYHYKGFPWWSREMLLTFCASNAGAEVWSLIEEQRSDTLWHMAKKQMKTVNEKVMKKS